MKLPAPLFAMASAVFFAIGMPSEKWLVAQTTPIMLAGLLYFSSGTAMTLTLLVQKIMAGKSASAGNAQSLPPATAQQAAEKGKIDRHDLIWVLVVSVVGGIFAPLLLLGAMRIANASTVALLLNFEIVVTALMARFIFKETLNRRVVFGLISVFLGGVCLSLDTNISASWSLLLVIGACICWSADSNFCNQVKHMSAVRIAQIKGLIAGSFNICLALAMGDKLPELAIIGGAAVTGVISHGISILCFVRALRHLGAARAVAYFATEPFIAALLSVIFLHEVLSVKMLIAGALMAFGVWLHLTEKHPPKHMDGAAIMQSIEVPATDLLDRPS
ncbi:MAG: DMT family transporter [Cyanobacteria bacterium SZAS TMP-1]|nr:DMT family transporter [Cyanobacteria bacterium SZAS TMP-1]